MRNFMMSLVGGAVGAWIVSTFVSSGYANDDRERVKSLIERGVCSVEVSMGMMTPGVQCYNNSVMVGFWNDNLYCAQVNVICP